MGNINFMDRVLRRFRPRPKGIRKELTDVELVTPAYKDRHVGKKFLVLGNGPSVFEHWGKIEQFINKHRPIVLGANNIGALYKPDYHGFTNRKRFAPSAVNIDSNRSKVLFSAYMPDEFIRLFYKGDYERLMYVNDHDATFDIKDGIVQASCRTVGILLMAVSIVMGSRGDLYAAGFDGWTPQVQEGREINFHSVQVLAHETMQYFVNAEDVSRRFFLEIDSYLKRECEGRLIMLTPTIYRQHYVEIQEYL